MWQGDGHPDSRLVMALPEVDVNTIGTRHFNKSGTFYHRDQSSELLKLVLKQVGKRSPGAMNFMVGNWLSVWKAWLSAFPVYDINWSHLDSWLPSPFRIAGSGNCDSWCSCVKKKNLTASSEPLGLEACVWWGGWRECEWQIPLLPGALVPPKPPFLPRPLTLGPLALTCRLINLGVMILSCSSTLSSRSFSWGGNACFRSLLGVESQRKDWSL